MLVTYTKRESYHKQNVNERTGHWTLKLKKIVKILEPDVKSHFKNFMCEGAYS